MCSPSGKNTSHLVLKKCTDNVISILGAGLFYLWSNSLISLKVLVGEDFQTWFSNRIDSISVGYAFLGSIILHYLFYQKNKQCKLNYLEVIGLCKYFEIMHMIIYFPLETCIFVVVYSPIKKVIWQI